MARGLLTGLAVLALALGAGMPATTAPAPAAPPAPAAQAAQAPQPVVAESPAESSASVTAAGTTDTSVEHRVPLAQIAFHYGQASDLSIQHGAAAAWLPAGSRPASALGQRAPPRH
ncbi:MAG TPA: hypothetical protein VFR67_15355 [Pilimelia sp.]|nr:hypothetical protein [Pilimelia sp.]